jgi:hypothetical protein
MNPSRCTRDRLVRAAHLTGAPFAGRASRSRPDARGRREAGRDSVRSTDGGRRARPPPVYRRWRAPDVEALGLDGAGSRGGARRADKSTTTGRAPVAKPSRSPTSSAATCSPTRLARKPLVAVERGVGVENHAIDQSRLGNVHPPAGRERRPRRGTGQGCRPRGQGWQAEALRPWAPGPRVRRRRRTRTFVVDAASARSWAPT